MRTIIDIPDTQVKILDQLSKRKNISRSEIIRQAMSSYITRHNQVKENYKMAFGLWKEKKLSSVSYQQALRNEWLEE